MNNIYDIETGEQVAKKKIRRSPYSTFSTSAGVIKMRTNDGKKLTNERALWLIKRVEFDIMEGK